MTEADLRLRRLYERRDELERRLEAATCRCEADPILHSLRLNKLAISDERGDHLQETSRG